MPDKSLPLTIGIDWGMDTAPKQIGQFRYVVELLTALQELQSDFHYVVYGKGKRPPEELAPLFDSPSPAWKWVQRPTIPSPRLNILFFPWWGKWRYRKDRLSLLHRIDSYIPIAPPLPVVFTIHDIMPEIFPKDYAEWIKMEAYQHYKQNIREDVSRVIAISQTTADDLRRLWAVSPHKVDVVHHGIHFSPPSPGTSLPSGITSRFLLSPYNLEPRKNLKAVLLAFPQIAEKFPDLKLVLFGNGATSPERVTEYEALVRDLNLQDKIIRTGLVTDEELAALYQRAEIFLFPSLYEGFGLPLLEAMISGACLVARKASSMAEIVEEGGLLVETSEPDEIAQATLRLLASDDERNRLRARAKQQAKNFSPKRMAKETKAVYLKTLGLISNTTNSG